MQKNQNIQTSSLFNDSILCINTSSNDSNIVHKKTATSNSFNFEKTSKDNNKKTLKN